MKNFCRIFLVACLTMISFGAGSQVKDISTSYRWQNVMIGGGGYVTGIAVHPKFPDVVYIRTDVGGAYRWDELQHRWIALTDWIGYEHSNLYGIDGIALDPNQKDVVYMAAGKYTKNANHDILKSENGGKTWRSTGFWNPHDSLKKYNFFGGNQSDRWVGEGLAVDPANSSTLLAGTRGNGLWISHDAAETWHPVGGPFEKGTIRSIVYGQPVNNAPATAYVALPEKGIYRSTDGGKNWELLAGITNPQQIRLSGNGDIYTTTKTGVFVLEGKIWKNISPNGNIWYKAISIDPFNADNMLVGEYQYGLYLTIWHSTDKGNTWRNITSRSIQHNSVPWVPANHFASATSAIAFDPHYRNRVWFTDWYATWRTYDITADSVHWSTFEKGHEEIVAFTLINPPSGAPLISGMADVRGFRHTNLDVFPEQELSGAKDKDVTGLDFCETNPKFLVRTSSHGTDKVRGTGAVSKDNGVTWTNFENWIYGANGRVAMSATNPDVIISIPWNDVPKRSADFGKTWKNVEGLPSGLVTNVWQWHQPLASDRVDGNVFYAFHKGAFYQSSNGGNSFEKISELPHNSFFSVKAAPGLKGEVWVSLDNEGLYQSSDGGKNFLKNPTVEWAHLFAFGKNPADKKFPAVFLYGTVKGQTGIFRSDDFGKTWLRINDEQHKLGNVPNCMGGDRQVFGRVYLGTNGRGIFYGATK